MTSPSPGMNSPADTKTTSPERSLELATLLDLPSGSKRLRHRLRLGLAQSVGLRLAASFGHGLGKVGEQHREPQPERDLQVEAELSAGGAAHREQQNGGEHAADFDHEHDGIAHHLARIQLQRTNPRSRAAHDLCSPKSTLPFCLSAICLLRKSFPPASAGVRESAPGSAPGKMSARPRSGSRRPAARVNSGVVTGNVPSDGGTYFFLRQVAGNRQHRDDHEEAADQHGDAQRRCCTSACSPSSPPKAEPLLPAPEVKA